MKFKTPQNPPSQLGVSRGEKIKLLLMSIGLVLVVGALVITIQSAQKYRSSESADLPETAFDLPEQVAYLPKIDGAKIAALVADAKPEDRVVLEREAIDEALSIARQMTAGSYAAAGAPELDAARIAALGGETDEKRGQPFFARGWIDALRTRRSGPTSDTEYIGRLILDDDSIAYFLTLSLPEGVVAGDYLRVDGLFLKLYSDESEEQRGTWLEGPLLVSAGATVSYPAMGPVTALDPYLLVQIEDDSVDGGITRLPFEPMWHAMAYTQGLGPDDVDWEAAPELDKATLEAILEDGTDSRMQAFRIPVSRLQSITILQAGENPARMDRYSEGWIGNTTWKNVIHYKAPFEFDRAELSDFVVAQGFFFKNLAYEPIGGGMHVAPVFILHSISRFTPGHSDGLSLFGYGVAGVAVGLLMLFTFLLTRDRRRSDRLQERLIARRRARRQALA